MTRSVGRRAIPAAPCARRPYPPGPGIEHVDLGEVELVQPPEAELELLHEIQLLRDGEAEVDPLHAIEPLRVVLLDRGVEELVQVAAVSAPSGPVLD
jgi:hypothetical protein